MVPGKYEKYYFMIKTTSTATSYSPNLIFLRNEFIKFVMFGIVTTTTTTPFNL
jgi:hypothetical protein